MPTVAVKLYQQDSFNDFDLQDSNRRRGLTAQAFFYYILSHTEHLEDLFEEEKAEKEALVQERMEAIIMLVP